MRLTRRTEAGSGAVEALPSLPAATWVEVPSSSFRARPGERCSAQGQVSPNCGLVKRFCRISPICVTTFRRVPETRYLRHFVARNVDLLHCVAGAGAAASDSTAVGRCQVGAQAERLPEATVDQVHVGAERERRVGVPEPVARLPDVATRVEQQRRAGVTEGVEARPRHAGISGRLLDQRGAGFGLRAASRCGVAKTGPTPSAGRVVHSFRASDCESGRSRRPLRLLSLVRAPR